MKSLANRLNDAHAAVASVNVYVHEDDQGAAETALRTLTAVGIEWAKHATVFSSVVGTRGHGYIKIGGSVEYFTWPTS